MCIRDSHTTSGVRFGWSDLARPAWRHDPAWRNTGLRTAATTSGVAEMHASGHHRRRGGTISPYERHKVMAQDRHNAMAASAGSHEVACLSITLHLRSCAGSRGALPNCVPKVRPSLHHARTCVAHRRKAAYLGGESRMFSLVVGLYFDIYRPGRSREMQKNDENGMIFAIYH